jgi:hypothetical protein
MRPKPGSRRSRNRLRAPHRRRLGRPGSVHLLEEGVDERLVVIPDHEAVGKVLQIGFDGIGDAHLLAEGGLLFVGRVLVERLQIFARAHVVVDALERLQGGGLAVVAAEELEQARILAGHGGAPVVALRVRRLRCGGRAAVVSAVVSAVLSVVSAVVVAVVSAVVVVVSVSSATITVASSAIKSMPSVVYGCRVSAASRPEGRRSGGPPRSWSAVRCRGGS